MLQYFHKIACFILLSTKLNFKERLSYDFDALFSLFGKVLETSVSIVLLFGLSEVVHGIADYSSADLLFVFGFAELSFALWHCFFINSLSLGNYANQGDLDRFLLRPIAPVLQILMAGFDDDGWGHLFVACLTLFIAWRLGAGPAFWWGWFLIIPSCFLGSIILFSLSLLFSSVDLLAKTRVGLGMLVMDFAVFARYPREIFPKGIRWLFVTVIPIAWCGSISAMAIVKRDFGDLFLLVIATVILLAVSLFVFRKMLARYYDGAGS